MIKEYKENEVPKEELPLTGCFCDWCKKKIVDQCFYRIVTTENNCDINKEQYSHPILKCNHIHANDKCFPKFMDLIGIHTKSYRKNTKYWASTISYIENTYDRYYRNSDHIPDKYREKFLAEYDYVVVNE